ncbi:MAG: hypothetical protein U0795_00910 [Pirellulales bacterium]
MTTNVFRFEIAPETSIEEAEMTLQLSIFAVEGLCGVARMRLDFGYHVDEEHRSIVVDATTKVGMWVLQVFTNLLVREFGEESFQVRRVADGSAPHTDGRAS